MYQNELTDHFRNELTSLSKIKPRTNLALFLFRMARRQEFEGYDVVMDSLAGKYFKGSYDALARGGRHVLFGAAVFTPRGRCFCVCF